MILSLDTASEYGSLALTQGEELVDQVLLHSPEGFGHILFGHLETLLARHGVRAADLDAFGVAHGPGSFTGVRVGVAAAKGLAEATGKPVVAVSNLRALAAFGSAPLRATYLDARRGEVFAGLFDAELRAQEPELVVNFDAWTASLPQTGVELIGRAAPPQGLAAAIGRIAWRELQAGRDAAPEAIDANYVRRSDAELFWKDSFNS